MITQPHYVREIVIVDTASKLTPLLLTRLHRTAPVTTLSCRPALEHYTCW